MRMPSAHDLRWVLRRALEQGRHLFTAEETALLHRLLATEDNDLATWGRLARRKDPVQRFEVPFTPLVEQGLLQPVLDARRALHRCTVVELRAALRTAGLPRSGRRRDLLERLTGVEPLPDLGRWIEVVGWSLLRHADRLAFLDRTPDPSRPVVARLGHGRWVDYEPDAPPPLFQDRHHWLRWKAVADAIARHDAGEEPDWDALEQAFLAGDGRAPGRLDAHGTAGDLLYTHARALERAGSTRAARRIYRTIAEALPERRVDCAIRTARCWEADGERLRALNVLRAVGPVEGPASLTLHRAGRRLARRCRRGWAPPPPLPPLRERRLRLPAVARLGDARPHYGDPPLPVEPAVQALLDAAGRRSRLAEGALWQHIYGLVFAPDAYFLPVGQLPVPHLDGPLDVGTPAFADRRPKAVEHAMMLVGEGRADELVRRTWERFGGHRLAGVRWTSLEDDLVLVEALPPRLLVTVLRTLLRWGWTAARGLPDLFVFPGETVILDGAWPRRLPPEPILVEIKTPHDRLDDAQRWWLAHLDDAIRVELWRIEEGPRPRRATA